MLRLFRKRIPAPQFAWCERSFATEVTPRHVRRLTEAGLRTGGGADTAALCGAEVSWDLSTVELADVAVSAATPHHVWRVCTGCAAAAAELNATTR